MAEITGLNGHALKSEGKKAVLTLEYELSTGKLAVGGEMGWHGWSIKYSGKQIPQKSLGTCKLP